MQHDETLKYSALVDTSRPNQGYLLAPSRITPALGRGYLCRPISLADGFNVYFQDFELYGEGVVSLGRDPINVPTVAFYTILSGVDSIPESWPGSATLSPLARVELCEYPTIAMQVRRGQPIRTVAITLEVDALGRICGLERKTLLKMLQEGETALARKSAAPKPMSFNIEQQIAAEQAFGALTFFPDDHLYLKAKALEILSLHLRQMRAIATGSSHAPHVHLDHVAMACGILKEEMSNPPRARELARRVGTNHNQLVTAFKDRLGKSPFSYLREIRLKQAQALLATGRYNVTEAAFQVGFSSPSHFTRAFKDQFGITPKSWTKHQRS